MQHRVPHDEPGGDLREIMIQQDTSEQRGGAKGMTCNRIRHQEPQRDNESSEESTKYAVDDYCLCGSPHSSRPREERAFDNMATRAATVYRRG
jgi:hypothetical protein